MCIGSVGRSGGDYAVSQQVREEMSPRHPPVSMRQAVLSVLDFRWAAKQQAALLPAEHMSHGARHCLEVFVVVLESG